MKKQKFGGYKDLQVWQKGVELVVDVYSYTKEYPKEEIYGLTSQTRRSVVSIPSNIAEGQSRKSSKEFIHFLRIAYASGAELETQLLIAEKLGYLKKDDHTKLSTQLHEIVCMVVGLIKSLNSDL